MLKHIMTASVSFLALTSIALAQAPVPKKGLTKYDGLDCGEYACVVSYGKDYQFIVVGQDKPVRFRDCQSMPSTSTRYKELKEQNLAIYACRDHVGHAYFVHQTNEANRLLSASTNFDQAIENAKKAMSGAASSNLWPK